jgi:anti-sigma regulatory factor (Ser/Thr protein kinase)
VPAEVLAFELGSLGEVRHLVARAGERARLPEERVGDLVLAVNELASNSTKHGSGRGVLRVWRDRDTLVCEVRDRGRIGDPLVGRQRLDLDRDAGWGLWIVNQVCDLVQVRTGSDGTVVRALMRVA